MRTTNMLVASAIAVVLGAACGGQTNQPAAGSTASTGDIASYQQLATNVQNGATTYRTNMIAPGTATTADCQRVHDAYDAQLRPWVSQMVQMSGGMDRYVDDHGGAGVADLGCVSATMMYELDRHHAAACTGADIGANRTEASRHVDAMLSYGGHMWDRCDQAMRGTDGGTWGWGPMMHGCENWDGCCSGMMHDGCCGGMGGMGGMHGGSCCGH